MAYGKIPYWPKDVPHRPKRVPIPADKAIKIANASSTEAACAVTFWNRFTLPPAGSNRDGTMIAVTFAQCGLLDFTGCGVRYVVRENHIVWHPPFGDLSVEILQNLLFRRLFARLGNNDQQR